MVPTIAATEIDSYFGITEATPVLSRKSVLIVTPPMDQLQDRRKTTIRVTNLNAHTFKISHGTVVANFKKLTAEQAIPVLLMFLDQLSFASMYRDEANFVINQRHKNTTYVLLSLFSFLFFFSFSVPLSFSMLGFCNFGSVTHSHSPQFRINAIKVNRTLIFRSPWSSDSTLPPLNVSTISTLHEELKQCVPVF